jgi:hypothetical protein
MGSDSVGHHGFSSRMRRTPEAACQLTGQLRQALDQLDTVIART